VEVPNTVAVVDGAKALVSVYDSGSVVVLRAVGSPCGRLQRDDGQRLFLKRLLPG
jgi:hypothetical protein